MIIDYTAGKFEDEANGVDCVLDTLGGEVLSRSLSVVKKGGIIVSTLSELSTQDLVRFGIRAAHIMARADSGQLAQIARLIDEGYVRPEVETVLPLEEARRAHEMSQKGHVRGKIVLKIKE